MEAEKEIRNMKVLQKSRRLPKEGDIFCLQVLENVYHFGRVIRTDAVIGPFKNVRLLYIYHATSTDPDDVPDLDRNDLLIPPEMTNNLGWARGYFKFIENRPLLDKDILPVNCFYSALQKKYFNEYWKQLEKRYEPCGEAGLASYSYIDYKISKALGLPTVED